MLDWDNFSFRDRDLEHKVYYKGSGPAVLIMHELPGLVPECVQFARRIVDRGYTVYLPLFFGQPNQPMSLLGTLKYTFHICISKEFRTLAKNKSSPITEWLRALCRDIYAKCGGVGVGAIGMCLTGGFALSLMIDERVMAPVLSQPSLPFSISREHRKALGISPEELEKAKQRAKECPILALRYEEDSISPADRFETLKQEFGDNIELYIISEQQRKDSGIKTSIPHAVLTVHAFEEAIVRVLKFLDARLKPINNPN
ncbi:MAG: dienelactone hydrolase family protein [Prochloraceae cyanobacterium]|nr:dienelactone hydrolase family protein [Prochloraceae cyanobacterium]